MLKIYTKNQIYNSHCYFTQYNDTYFRITLNKYQREKGYEEINKKLTSINNSDEYQRQSLSRTKRNIKEIALCNNFQYFTTITINSKNCDRYSLIETQELLRKKLYKIKRKNKNFAFIFITEKHKDGAFHFHGLTRDIPLYINKNNYYSNSTLDEIGYNSFSIIKDYNKCCNYITKYITKECIRNEHNQIYISSRGLKKADKYEIPLLDIDWTYENDFCKISDFNLNTMTFEEKMKFLHIIGEI